MTHAAILARLRSALPGWSVDYHPTEYGWTYLEGGRCPIQAHVILRRGERQTYLLELGTRRYGRVLTWCRSWHGDPWPGGRGWVERYAAHVRELEGA